jgi:N-acetylmuramoyl-L-alanine amidase
MIGVRAATKLGVIFAIALLAAGVEGLRAQGASQAASESCARASFRVVVDVGHTADVPGAMSARGIPEYAFNLQLAREIKQALIDAGFEQTVLLITTTAPRLGLVERAARANSMHANLFIAIHHDSVPDNLKHNWDYGGQKNEFNDDYPGYAIFISNENADPAGSLRFGHLLGRELERRSLYYTPHYTLALMGHHRRILLDSEAGVYRYDQLVVLRRTACRRCCSRLDRSLTGRKNSNWERRSGVRSPALPLSPRWRISAPPARDRLVSEPLLLGIAMM